MSHEQEIKDSIEMLNKDNLQSIATALQFLSGNPSGDTNVLPHIERFLEDTRLCILGIPYEYGEIRWLAAHALASERGVLGIDEPVYLKGVAKPLSQKQVYALLDELEPNWKNDPKSPFEWLETLKAEGRLPTYDKIFPSKKRFASK